MTFKRDLLLAWLAIGTLAACRASEPTPMPVAKRVDVIRGVPARSTPGRTLDTVQVRLGDSDGRPVVDHPASWSGEGHIKVLDALSDHDGILRAVWTLPRFVDDYTLDFGAGPTGRYSLRLTAGELNHTFVTETAVAMARSIDATFTYGCGIWDEELVCWGRTIVPRPKPSRKLIQIPLPGGVSPTLVRTGSHVLCILDNSDTAWCTRASDAGAWRRIEGAPPLSQLNISGDPEDDGTVCGLARSDGMVWCWPVRGLSTTATATGFGPFTTISGKSDTVCGLDPDQAAWCWGQNRRGQLGDGTIDPSTTPVRVAGNLRFDRLAVGHELSCGRSLAGQVWCWGGITSDQSTSVPRVVDEPWSVGSEIVVGYSSDLYLRKGGRVRLWAANRMWDELDYSHYEAAEFVAYGHACLRQVTDEIYCSRDLAEELIEHPVYTSQLVAVSVD